MRNLIRKVEVLVAGATCSMPVPEAAECAFGEICGHWALPAHERCAECVQGKKEDAP